MDVWRIVFLIPQIHHNCDSVKMADRWHFVTSLEISIGDISPIVKQKLLSSVFTGDRYLFMKGKEQCLFGKERRGYAAKILRHI